MDRNGTPDGKVEWHFQPTRTGLMQLWRMKPDGSQPEQVTSDEYNNWFPIHLSRWEMDVLPIFFQGSV